MKYTIVIQWSNKDNCFVVFLPEFELLIESLIQENQPLPVIKPFFKVA